ncbi:MAG: caspase family protein [Bacteroidales bacterium]
MKKRVVFTVIFSLLLSQFTPAQDRATAEKYATQASTARQNGNAQEAIRLYTLAINAAPTRGSYYKSRAWVYKSIKEYNLAIADYNSAISVETYTPYKVEYYQEIAKLYWYMDKSSLAIFNCSQAVDLAKSSVENIEELINSYALRAKIQKSIGNNVGFEEDIVNIGSCNITGGDDYCARAEVYKDLGLFQKAIDDYTKAISAVATSDNAVQLQEYYYLRRAYVKSDMGDYEGAIADYTSSIQLDPDGSKFMSRANAYEKAGRYQKAIDDDTNAMTYFRDDKSKGTLSSVYNNRGWHKKCTKDYVGAQVDYSTAIQINPDNGSAYWNRGLTYAEVGLREDAVASYTQAMKYYQNDPDNLAKLYYLRGSNCSGQDAMNDFSKAIELNPKYYSAYWSRANAFKLQGQYPKALDDYTAAISVLKSKFVKSLVLQDRADTKILMGDYDGAVNDYNQCIDIEPSASSYYYRGKFLSIYMNKSTEARSDFEKALSLMDSKSILYPFCLYFLGDRENAIASMRTLINTELTPQFGYYNLACLHSLMGNEKEAIVCLDSALYNGYKDHKGLKTDEDFINIKFKPAFKTLLAKYQIPYDIKIENLTRLITQDVRVEFGKWQEKGEFETNQQYMERMKTREAKVAELTTKATDRYKKIHMEEVKGKGFTLDKYDAESQTFKMTSAESGDVAIVSVPLADAPSFKDNQAKLKISKQNYIIQNNNWALSYMEVQNPANGKIYKFDITKQANYDPRSKFVLNYADIKVDIPNEEVKIVQQTTAQSDKKIVLGRPEIDTNIPVSNVQKTNTYCLIIGNEDYSSFQTGLSTEVNVDYAANDAKIFKEYCNKTLGIPEKQIKLLVNATAGQMNQGIAWINNLAKIDNGSAEIIFYYSGHGLPDEQTKEAYLIPVDISGSNVTQGIKLNDVYAKLNEFPAKKVTVFLDACFSGGARNQGLIAMKGVKVRPKDNLVAGNMVVFSSSTGEESSGVYRDMQHGYMTYFLLKKLQETKGDINYKDIADYIIESVKKETALNGKIQTPQLNYSPSVDGVWDGWKIK